MLMSLSRSLSTSLLVADILCARENEEFKARLLSTTMFLSGICTLLQNTIGVRSSAFLSDQTGTGLGLQAVFIHNMSSRDSL